MKLISRILILVLACMMLLTSCETDDKNADNKATATVEVTEAPTATATTEPTASTSPTESLPTTEVTQTPVTEPSENPATTEEPIVTTKPTVQPVVTEKPTTKPTSTSKPTVAPTNKPTETVKPTTPVPTTTPTPTATAKPTPTLDPSVDYSQWGKHGFENLLPIPLPFSDEEADWRSKKLSSTLFQVKNFKMIYFENSDAFVSTIKEYAKSFESLGYTHKFEEYVYTVYSETGRFTLKCNANGYMSVDIKIIS